MKQLNLFTDEQLPTSTHHPCVEAEPVLSTSEKMPFSGSVKKEKIQNKIREHWVKGLKLCNIFGSPQMGALFNNDNKYNRVINYVRRTMAEGKKGIKLSKKDVEEVLRD